jgi:cytidine deaminase
VDQELNSYSSILAAARFAREKAYAPYSKFELGAAVVTASGQTFSGCNNEKVWFGCAETGAVAVAIANGHRNLAAIAIVAHSSQPSVPRGACRQVIAEFNLNLTVITATTEGVMQKCELSRLLPAPKQGVLEEADRV